MGILLKNRDYVSDGSGVACVSGGEELLNRVLFLLTAKRGSFPLQPELGSRLYLLRNAKPAQWESLASQYVTEALAGEPFLSVTTVRVRQEDERLWVEADLRWNEQVLSAQLDV